MRVAYRVSPWKDGWQVRHGHTEPLRFGSYERAVRAAEALARAAVEAGDTSVVSVQGPGASAVSVFRPALPARPAGARFDPEQDEAARAERLAHARI